MLRRCSSILIGFLAITVTSQAWGYYAAHMGRFISRDPIARVGAGVQPTMPTQGRLVDRTDTTDPSLNLDDGRHYYVAESGRLVSRDHPNGYEGEINLYEYVSSRPLNHVDPMGLQADSVSQAIKRCCELPFPANIKCLNDILDSGYGKQKELRILQCQLVHAAYKAAGKKCRSCSPTMTKCQLLQNAACFSSEVAIRARYLSMKCDYILPGSIARGSKVAEKGHIMEMSQKSAAAAACYAMAAKAKK